MGDPPSGDMATEENNFNFLFQPNKEVFDLWSFLPCLKNNPVS